MYISYTFFYFDLRITFSNTVDYLTHEYTLNIFIDSPRLNDTLTYKLLYIKSYSYIFNNDN
jgi:hypothetical protein